MLASSEKLHKRSGKIYYYTIFLEKYRFYARRQNLPSSVGSLPIYERSPRHAYNRAAKLIELSRNNLERALSTDNELFLYLF